MSRDDLVARVWPGVFVTGDVLHRAIRELRRAFGDDSAKPAYISTATGTREPLTLPVPATLGDYSPAVSPDGTRIAFVRGINGATADIFTIPSNGGAATRVTWDNQDLVGPDLSPDVRQIAFVSTRSVSAELWVADRSGANARQLSTFGRASMRQPRWSPDGRRVLISAGVNGQMDLYAIDAASGTSSRLTNDADDEVAPSWSRDGSSVIFGARIAGSWQLLQLDPTARHPHPADDHRRVLRTGIAGWPQHPVHAPGRTRCLDHAPRRRYAQPVSSRRSRRRVRELPRHHQRHLLRRRHRRSNRRPASAAHWWTRRRRGLARQLLVAGFCRDARWRTRALPSLGPAREQHHGARRQAASAFRRMDKRHNTCSALRPRCILPSRAVTLCQSRC